MRFVNLLFDRLILQKDTQAVQPHEEAHYLKNMVFGGLDGILTGFAIVAGAAGEPSG